MGWFSRTKEKIKAGFGKVVSSIAAGTSTVIADVASFVGAKETAENLRISAEGWRDERKKWDDRLRELKIESKFSRGSKGEELEKKDTENIKAIQDRFKERYATETLSNKMRNMTVTERCEEMKGVAEDVGKILGIKEQPEVVFFEPTYENRLMMGAYNHTEKKLYLNVACVACNDPRVYVEQASTIVHEMVHAMQFQMILSDDTQGYSKDLVNRWRFNAGHYFQPEDGDMLYSTQPLEAWAFGYERAIKKYLK